LGQSGGFTKGLTKEEGLSAIYRLKDGMQLALVPEA
jgi:hypothetical protein